VHRQVERFLHSFQTLVEQHRQQLGGMHAPIRVGHANDNEVRQKLDEKIELDFLETPLVDLVDYIADACKIPVCLDVVALDDFGISTGTPITVCATGIPLRTGLRRVLHDLELAWVVRDEVLVISSENEIEDSLPIVFYPVHDLLDPAAADDEEGIGDQYDTIVNAITTAVDPETWENVGGPGAISVIRQPPALMIAQTEETHDRVVGMLDQLRRAKQVERRQLAEHPLPPAPPSLPRLEIYALNVEGQLATAQEAAELIRKTIDPESWVRDPGLIVESIGNTLVVRQTERNHRRIRQLLQRLGIQPPWGQPGMPGGTVGGFGGGGGGMFRIER
jgi:hypothetical protein